MSASAAFEQFSLASSFRGIQQAFFQLCVAVGVDPTDYQNVYKRVRTIDDWKAQKLFKLLDKRASQAEYRGQQAASFSVVVIGAGPCGLRSAIEAALLGCRVVVVEQRDKFSRNNVLHLWEFVISDLKGLGAKFFYPRFCTGSIEHISIRQLQCILLKVSLLFGVQVYDSVAFVQLLLPQEATEDGEGCGFRAFVEPADHIVSTYDFDILIGADGKRNTVPGFPREEMRGKLAIGITANFANKRSAEEERVPEISGVAYIFNQSFFKEMYEVTGVDLENIVYYKDETHYFVMCAKKQCLLEKKVIKQDTEDISALLSPANVDERALCNFAASAADFATKGGLPTLDFALNHRGRPDVAMFDFTSLYSSKCSVRLVEKGGRKLLLAIVGDSLHEPFWPTGSGCARGFLGVWDTAWLIRELAVSARPPIELIADRESVFRLLTQVTKDNMHKNVSKYTIDPRTRYISLEMGVKPEDVQMLVWSDSSSAAPLGSHKQLLPVFSYFRFCLHALSSYKIRLVNMDSSWSDGRPLAALLHKFYPDAIDYANVIAIESLDQRMQACFDVVSSVLDISPPETKWTELSDEELTEWLCSVVEEIRKDGENVKRAITPRTTSMKRKIHSQVDASKSKKTEQVENLARNLLECSTFRGNDPLPKERSSPPENIKDSERPPTTISPKAYTKRPLVDKLNPILLNKVERIVTGEVVRQEEKELRDEKVLRAEAKTRKMEKKDIEDMEERLMKTGMGLLMNRKLTSTYTEREEKMMKIRAADARKEAEEGFARNAEKERFKEVDESLRRSEEILKKKELSGLDSVFQYRKNHDRKPPPAPPTKTVTVERDDEDEVVIRRVTRSPPRRIVSMPVVDYTKQTCALCEKPVYLAERMQVESQWVHRRCFRCAYCAQPLRLGECAVDKDVDQYYRNKYYCRAHTRIPVKEKLARIERERKKLGNKEGSLDCASSVPPSTPISPRRHSAAPSTATPSTTIISITPSATQVPSTRTISPSNTKSTTKNGTHSSTLFFFSPEAIRDKISRKIEENAKLAPERAELTFDEQRGGESPKQSSSSSDGTEEEDEEREDEEEIHEEEEEEEELAEDELVELEKTVSEMDEQNIGHGSQKEALLIINEINRRRSAVHTPMEKKEDEENLREKKMNEWEKRREEARERAKRKSDEQLGLGPTTGTHADAAHSDASRSPSGLLARLFSPSSVRKTLMETPPSLVDGDSIQIESGKETTLLSKSWRRLKMTRGNSQDNGKDVENEVPSPMVSRRVPPSLAIISPSPRSPVAASEAPSTSSPSRGLSTDDAGIRMMQKKIERIRRQREADQRRTAQDIQRGLNETENRIEEVNREGRETEQRLAKDVRNTWLMDGWLSLVQERDRLREREDDLRLRAKEMQLDELYRTLNSRFRNMAEDVADEEQSQLLQDMLAAIKERGVVRAQSESVRKRPRNRRDPAEIMKEHGYNYLNFKPVFL